MAPSTSAPLEVEHDAAAAAPGFFSSIAAFFLPTAHAEAPAKDDAEDKDDSAEEKEEKEDGGDEEAASGGDEEEEEEEPEDPAPAIRQECEEGECKAPAKHFKHCSEKVEAGEGWHGEDCVEELFHLMHCVDGCAAPKVFKKLA